MRKIRFVSYLMIPLASGLFCISLAFAYVMSSDSYRIQQDSLNVGGVDFSSSGSYKLSDTVGEMATGKSSSDSYNLYAGYRQMDEVYISITHPDNVALAPSIPGITGGTGDGSAAWTVITDNSAGYSLTISATSTSGGPVMRADAGGYTFADYSPAAGIGGAPDFSWSVLSTDSEFGFTPEGTGIVQKFQDSGGVCNVSGGDTADACWYYIATTTAETIVQNTSANHPSGTQTTIKFRATSGADHAQMEGTYTATTTVTAITL